MGKKIPENIKPTCLILPSHTYQFPEMAPLTYPCKRRAEKTWGMAGGGRASYLLSDRNNIRNNSPWSHQIANNIPIIKSDESHLSLPHFSLSLLFETVGNLIQKSYTFFFFLLSHSQHSCTLYQSSGHLKDPQGTPYSKANIIGFESDKSIWILPLSFIIWSKLFNQQFSHL